MTDYNNEMIAQLAGVLRRPARKTGSQGVRIPYEWILNILDGDVLLTRRVLREAGFTPPSSTDWSCGRGERALEAVCYPTLVSDQLTDILDLHSA